MNNTYREAYCNPGLISACFCSDRKSNGIRAMENTRQPFQMVSLKEEENFVADALTKLSFKERSQALDDVHCVGEDKAECPVMVKESLVAFQAEVEKLADPTYMRAVSQNRDYIESESFQLMFLRSNLYDARQAARGMIKHLQCRETWYGSHTLGRDICLSDLQPEDREILASGIFHIQSERDPSGRVVIYLFNDMFLRKYKIEHMIRAGGFMFSNLIRSHVDVQLQGATIVYYDVTREGEHEDIQSWDSCLTLMNQALVLPIRYSSVHFCMRNDGRSLSINKVFLQVMLNGFPKYTTVRTRFHYGSDIELQYILRSHGVPLNTFPVDTQGKRRKKLIDALYEEHCSAKHAADTPMLSGARILTPNQIDVLLGRGKKIQNHPGNISFRNFMHEHRDEYDNAYKFKRRRVAMELKQRYAIKGVRFLKQMSDSEWTVATGPEVEEKVKQLFRSFRRDT